MKIILFNLLCLFFFSDFQTENFSENFENTEIKEPETNFVDTKKNLLSPERDTKVKDLPVAKSNLAGNMLIAKFQTVNVGLEKESENKRIEVSVNLIAIDQNKFDAHGIKLYKNSRLESLNDINHVLISKGFALEYFGEEDPFNKILILDDKCVVFIKGVFISDAVAFKFDIITGPQTFDRIGI